MKKYIVITEDVLINHVYYEIFDDENIAQKELKENNEGLGSIEGQFSKLVTCNTDKEFSSLIKRIEKKNKMSSDALMMEL